MNDKKVTFKGRVNDQEFTDVNEYNKAIEAAIENGTLKCAETRTSYEYCNQCDCGRTLINKNDKVVDDSPEAVFKELMGREHDDILNTIHDMHDFLQNDDESDEDKAELMDDIHDMYVLAERAKNSAHERMERMMEHINALQGEMTDLREKLNDSNWKGHWSTIAAKAAKTQTAIENTSMNIDALTVELSKLDLICDGLDNLRMKPEDLIGLCEEPTDLFPGTIEPSDEDFEALEPSVKDIVDKLKKLIFG